MCMILYLICAFNNLIIYLFVRHQQTNGQLLIHHIQKKCTKITTTISNKLKYVTCNKDLVITTNSQKKTINSY
jgi:hypothetical protein